MSLKAKLEAVIYAAEEPVTLAQLAALFAEEAFAWKHEQAELAGLAEQANPQTTLDELIAEAKVEAITEANPEVADTLPESDPASPADSASPAAPAPDPELEAKRQERKRDREVRDILRTLLDQLIAEYAADTRGIEIREIAGGFRLGTKPEMHDAVRSFVKSLKPALKLSLPALETLAVIAYKQPVTAPEVGEIRGVDSAGVLGSLMSRKLIATAGRKQVIGRPMLYKTTKEFLLRFGLKDVSELPSMDEFEKMAALELSEDTDIQDSAADLSGDLFAETESTEPESTAEASKLQTATTITPTAEPSEEAAEAQAPVERLDAEEIEAEV